MGKKRKGRRHHIPSSQCAHPLTRGWHVHVDCEWVPTKIEFEEAVPGARWRTSWNGFNYEYELFSATEGRQINTGTLTTRNVKWFEEPADTAAGRLEADVPAETPEGRLGRQVRICRLAAESQDQTVISSGTVPRAGSSVEWLRAAEASNPKLAKTVLPLPESVARPASAVAAVKCPKPPLPSPPEHVLRKSTAEQMIHGEERIPKTRRAFIRANNEENDREELVVVPWKMCPTVGELLQSINKRIDWKCDELRRARNNRLLNMDDLCADVIEPDEQIVASACRKRQRERRRTQRSQSRNTRKRRSQRESRSRHRRHPRSPPTRSPTRSQTRSPPPRSPKPEGVPQSSSQHQTEKVLHKKAMKAAKATPCEKTTSKTAGGRASDFYKTAADKILKTSLLRSDLDNCVDQDIDQLRQAAGAIRLGMRVIIKDDKKDDRAHSMGPASSSPKRKWM